MSYSFGNEEEGKIQKEDLKKTAQLEDLKKTAQLDIESDKKGDLIKRYQDLHSIKQLILWITIDVLLVIEMALLIALCEVSFSPPITSQNHFDVFGSNFQVPQAWEACILVQILIGIVNFIGIIALARWIRKEKLDELPPSKEVNEKIYRQVYATGAFTHAILIPRIFFIVGEASIWYAVHGLDNWIVGTYAFRYLAALMGVTIGLFTRKRADFDSLHYFGLLVNVLTIAGNYGIYLNNTDGSAGYKSLIFWSLAANIFILFYAPVSAGYLPRLYLHYFQPHKLEKRERNPTAYIAEKEVNRIGTLYFWFFALPLICISAAVSIGPLSLVPSAIASIVTSFNIFRTLQEPAVADD